MIQAPWQAWQPATCLPNHCFCEAIRSGWIRQPANTLSSLAFVVVGLWVAYDARRRTPNATSLLLIVSLFCIGLGSAFYHASLSFLGQFADVFGMYLLGTLVLVNAAGHLAPWRSRTTVTAYLLLNAALAWSLVAVPGLRRWLFAAVMVPAIVLTWRVFSQATTSRSARALLASVGVFAIAFVVWALDLTRVVCRPNSWLQGHAVWHVLGAVAAAGYYVALRDIKYILRRELHS